MKKSGWYLKSESFFAKVWDVEYNSAGRPPNGTRGATPSFLELFSWRSDPWFSKNVFSDCKECWKNIFFFPILGTDCACIVVGNILPFLIHFLLFCFILLLFSAFFPWKLNLSSYLNFWSFSVQTVADHNCDKLSGL